MERKPTVGSRKNCNNLKSSRTMTKKKRKRKENASYTEKGVWGRGRWKSAVSKIACLRRVDAQNGAYP